MQYGRGVHQFGIAARMAYTRHDEVAQDEFVYGRQVLAVYGLIAYLYRHGTFNQIGSVAVYTCGLLLFTGIYSEYVTQCQQRGYSTYHTERIGHGITGGYLGGVGPCVHIAERLLSGTQTGRIGNGTRHNANHGRHRDAGYVMERNGYTHAENHHYHGQLVECNAPLTERREETGPHLQAYRVHEQYQPELFHEMKQMLVYVHPEISERYTHEKNAGDTQRDTRHLQFAEYYPQSYHQRQYQYRMGHASTP